MGRGSPTSFAPNQVIKGWTEAMQLMVEGDKWEMYIPSDLGYGDGGSGATIKGGYVEKQSKNTAEKRKSELKRLEGMQGGEMKPENKNWLMSRIKILKKMVKNDEL